ncbi:unnamed protein product [Acanthosepion pharaonis]|uniref:HTH psq-type domain-containing protein n=1 Tax=Acanthosepion pharaonis TaxID=158019 RepID=A0A812AP58_ACAPH|nr:unnamed protein product [Sepia pharaonis]
MAPKRAASFKAGTETKRKRSMMTITERMKHLDMLKEGRTFAAVARHFSVNESTVRYIKKDEANIRKTAAINFNMSTKRVVTARNTTNIRMELLWPSLYETFAAKEPEDDSGDREEGEEDEDEVEHPQPGTSSDSQPKKTSFFCWQNDVFYPQVNVYLLEQGLPFEILLLDNAGGHAIDSLHEGIQIEFMPPNTTPLYSANGPGSYQGVQGLIHEECSGKALQEMKLTSINMSWKNLWPEVIYDDKGYTPAEIQHSVVGCDHWAESFASMTMGDIDDLFDCQSQPLTDQDLEDLTNSASEEEETQ